MPVLLVRDPTGSSGRGWAEEVGSALGEKVGEVLLGLGLAGGNAGMGLQGLRDGEMGFVAGVTPGASSALFLQPLMFACCPLHRCYPPGSP